MRLQFPQIEQHILLRPRYNTLTSRLRLSPTWNRKAAAQQEREARLGQRGETCVREMEYHARGRDVYFQAGDWHVSRLRDVVSSSVLGSEVALCRYALCEEGSN